MQFLEALRMRDRRKRPVVRSDGKRYESESDAARDVIGDQTNISRACRNQKRTAYGYGWRYAWDTTSS